MFVLHFETERFTLIQMLIMATKVQVTTPAQHDSKLPVVRNFLVDIAKKYNVRIDDLMVGMIGDSMHIWRYDSGANNPFQQLEIVEF